MGRAEAWKYTYRVSTARTVSEWRPEEAWTSAVRVATTVEWERMGRDVLRRVPKAHIFSSGCLIRDRAFGRVARSRREWKRAEWGAHEGSWGTRRRL